MNFGPLDSLLPPLCLPPLSSLFTESHHAHLPTYYTSTTSAGGEAPLLPIPSIHKSLSHSIIPILSYYHIPGDPHKQAMYCMQWFLVLFLLPFPQASSFFCLSFLLCMFLSHKPCLYWYGFTSSFGAFLRLTQICSTHSSLVIFALLSSSCYYSDTPGSGRRCWVDFGNEGWLFEGRLKGMVYLNSLDAGAARLESPSEDLGSSSLAVPSVELHAKRSKRGGEEVYVSSIP